MSSSDAKGSSSGQSPPGGWPVPKSAYIHVPFCRHRCGYCNFSVVSDRDDLVERFLAAIDTELATLDCPPIETMFIGGGTPTHLSTEQLSRFVTRLRERFVFDSRCEFTMEANPEDITNEKLRVMVDHGVNRVSLGIQSFDDRKLQILERGHRGGEAQDVVRQVADQIENVSIDLIFAAPEESIDVWRRDVDIALALPITHLSTYALTYEKGTRFWSRRFKGELNSATESVEVDMYQYARQATELIGMPQYEISSFSRPAFQCQHNITYWRGDGWFAAGPGATRFANGRRDSNHRSTTTYLHRIESGRSPVGETEVLDRTEYARERVAFGIRMMAGVDLDAIGQETGVNLRQLCSEAITKFTNEGLIEQSASVLRLTDRGVLFADMVAADFLG